MQIPDQLRAYFHDSTLTLHSYDAENRQLLVHIEKEIGPETGIITFGDVSFISIPDCFPGDAIKATPVSELPDEFWHHYSAYLDLFEADDIAFQIYDQEGPVHLVVAKTISYEVIPENGVTK
jgi:hypothetical protein